MISDSVSNKLNAQYNKSKVFAMFDRPLLHVPKTRELREELAARRLKREAASQIVETIPPGTLDHEPDPIMADKLVADFRRAFPMLSDRWLRP